MSSAMDKLHSRTRSNSTSLLFLAETEAGQRRTSEMLCHPEREREIPLKLHMATGKRLSRKRRIGLPAKVCTSAL